MHDLYFTAPSAPDASANGKALEYACLAALERRLTSGSAVVRMLDSAPARTASKRFADLPPAARRAYEAGARQGIELLARVEPLIRAPAGRFTLSLQSDAQGIVGDVRDLLVSNHRGWELGVLVKHNNDAAKHPRLSGDSDFAAHWFGARASRGYFLAVKPVFDELERFAATGSHWSALGLREHEKASRFYRPVLAALAAELRRHAAQTPTMPVLLLRYMTGRRDFYKLIVAIKRRTVELQAFCFDGELGQSPPSFKAESLSIPRLHAPTRLLALDFKPHSDNTLILRFDVGWALSLRLHSASSRVERSLKLDVRLVSTPPEMLRLAASWQD